MAKNLTKTRDRIGRLNLYITGEDYSKYSSDKDIFDSTERILGKIGKRIYYIFRDIENKRVSMFHFNNSTIILDYSRKRDQTELHVFGDAKKTIKKLEEVFA